MREKTELKSRARRAFLKAAGLGAGAVGVLAVSLGRGSPKATAAEAGRGKRGYRETPHVKTFYNTARF